MKVLTVHQPWAELIACGAKRIETRGWNTWYRGPLAIHASKEKKYLWSESVIDGEIQKTLRQNNNGNPVKFNDVLQFGEIIAVCNLRDCFPISSSLYVKPFKQDLWKMVESPHGFEQKLCYSIQIPPVEPELSFGDYTPGRYAWILVDVRRLAVPIPTKGKQKLWEFDIPEEVLAHE